MLRRSGETDVSGDSRSSVLGRGGCVSADMVVSPFSLELP